MDLVADDAYLGRAFALMENYFEDVDREQWYPVASIGAICAKYLDDGGDLSLLERLASKLWSQRSDPNDVVGRAAVTDLVRLLVPKKFPPE